MSGMILGCGDFRLALPPAIVLHMRKQLDAYIDGLLVKPDLLDGKLVVEQDDVPGPGPTHILRWLFTADYDEGKRKKAKDFRVSATPTPVQMQGYFESWMVILQCKLTATGLSQKMFEIYVHRDGGWERVHGFSGTNSLKDPRTHEDGDPWPTPPGEMPHNTVYISKGWLTGLGPHYDKCQRTLDTLIACGAQVVQDEIIVDMTDSNQRRTYWCLERELREARA